MRERCWQLCIFCIIFFYIKSHEWFSTLPISGNYIRDYLLFNSSNFIYMELYLYGIAIRHYIEQLGIVRNKTIDFSPFEFF